jgi:chromosome segregation protein
MTKSTNNDFPSPVKGRGAGASGGGEASRTVRGRGAGASGGEASGLVGNRVLVGAQMVDISRLSTHPVPLISQGLITVAGQGPTDSNGAGKSSFIAGLSLLHADDQWKLASGAAGAAELLFTAELAAQETRYSNADHGYLIGIFADPGQRSLAELRASALSVWLRINRKAPYLDLRWHDGLYVPYGETEADRVARVDEMWRALPMSNGRTDFHASRLSTFLFGGRARCVSFLSTSVRSSPTPNLLAQPLNELSPGRIFDAIANLTGLDRELEAEAALRSKEHGHRVDVQQAERDLETWEQEVAVVEAGIAQRLAAREQLGGAQAAWHNRCARYFVDGLARAEEIRAALTELDHDAKRLGEDLADVGTKIAALSDDAEFDRRFTEAKRYRDELVAKDKSLDTAHQVAASQIETLAAQQRDRLDRARAADGRSLAAAGDELAAARAAVEDAAGDRGAARAAEKRAAELLAAAESGQDLAAAPLRVLSEAGVPAAALLDIVELESGQRAAWEPRLSLFREAAVVPRDQAGRAAGLLAGLPGSTLILADGPGEPKPSRTKAAKAGTTKASTTKASTTKASTTKASTARSGAADLPVSCDPRFDLTGFLTAIGQRAGSGAQEVDAAAGVLTLGGFAEPIAGRAGRVLAAQQAHREVAEQLDRAERSMATVQKDLALAEERRNAAQAAEQAAEIQQRIDGLRKENAARADERDALEPLLAAAENAYATALGGKQAREEKIANLRGERGRLRASQDRTAQQKDALIAERDALDLLGRQAAWGDGDAAARAYLLSLGDSPGGDSRAERATADWDEEACGLLGDAVRRCFPDGTPPEEMPEEIRVLLVEQRWLRASLEARVPLVPALLRALRTHLNVTEEHDSYQQKQIAAQRAERTADLDAARTGLGEAEQTCQAHRASLALGIKATLKQVALKFDELDQAYGGYGAGLDFPEPDPPAEPDRPWQWTVAPKWRRAEGQRLGGYNLKANTAQIDEKAAKLVCAAALAAGGDRPLMLILDELGRNLGKQHRREAVALFEQIGNDRNITVVGALQDDMERYAVESSGLYIKLRRSSDAIAYNEPPVVIGDESNRARVELLRGWMASYRPGDEGPPAGEGSADGFTEPELEGLV